MAAACAATAQAQDAREPEPLRAELVAEQVALVPGARASFGVLLRHRPHWHSYWINPGDSGLPTTLEWALPAGYIAGAIDWPLPRRFEVGGLYNIGYDGEVLLPVSITVPADATPGTTAQVGVSVKWLACREDCIPGKASLALELPLVREAPAADPRWQAAFAAARAAQPQATAWRGEARDDGHRISIRLAGPALPPPQAKLDAFVVQRKLVDYAPPAIGRDGDALRLEAGRSEYFAQAPAEVELVLVQADAPSPRGWRVRVPYAAGGGTTPVARGPSDAVPSPGSPR